MKTTTTFQTSAKAGSNLFGGFLLIGLLSTAIFSINLAGSSDLLTALESQWLNFTNAMSGFTAQVHPAQW